MPPGRFEPFWGLVEGLLAPDGRVFFVDEGRHFLWREDWVDETAGVVRRPLADGTVHRAVKVLWRADDLAARLADLGWNASVTDQGPFYWGTRRPVVAYATIGGSIDAMPAITVDDITILPRIPSPDPVHARQRAVRERHDARRRGFEGDGFPVRRAFAGVDLGELDPFIHLDQMGEVEYAPGEPKGTPWHPHRGFETVTYMIDGTFEHSDSNGGGGVITNGDTQWMTAGAGILHIEKPPEALVVSGGLFHGFQLWVNLPSARSGPRRATRTSAPARSVCWRRTTGERSCASSPARSPATPGPGSTYTPMTLVHATLSPEAELRCRGGRTTTRSSTSWPALARSAQSGSPIQMGQLAVFGPGNALSVAAARSQESRSPTLDVLDPRRPPDPRAGRVGGPVRDEHARRGDAGLHRLPGGPARQRSRRSTERRPPSPSRSPVTAT